MNQIQSANKPQVWVEDAKRRGEAIMKEAEEQEREQRRKGHDRPTTSKDEATEQGIRLARIGRGGYFPI